MPGPAFLLAAPALESAGVNEPPAAAPAALELAGLVRSAQAGDQAAFGTLYHRYARMVHGLLLAHADRDEVHDLVQDVFVSAMGRIRSLRDPLAFGGWLGSIARNRARMHHRARRPSAPLDEEMHASGGSPDAALGAAEALAALRRLPERFREPLLLRLVEGLSGEEIAERLGLSHGTVRVYLHHGMAQLRELLGETHA